MTKQRTTQRDIARHLGVHVTTVSMALRHHVSLPPETWQRVEEAARKLHYVPDPALSALMEYRRTAKSTGGLKQMLAYLTCWPTADAWKSGFAHRQIYEGALARATEMGYGLTHQWLPELGARQATRNRVLKTRNYAGLIVAATPAGRGHLRLDWPAYCAVKIDSGFVWPPLLSVGNNQIQMMRLAIRRVWHRGYRRIGFACRTTNNERVDRFWSAAYLDELMRVAEAPAPPMLLTEDWNAATLAKWVRRHRIELVLGVDASMPGWLTEQGLDVPSRVGFVNLDLRNSSGDCAGILENHAEVGATAVELLDGLIRRNDRGLPRAPKRLLVDGVWMEGTTIRPASASPAKPRKTLRSRGANHPLSTQP